MRCYFSFFFLAVITTASALNDTEEWINFKKNHGKTYKSPEEENYRFSVFQASLRKIEEHNAKFEQGLATYKMGINTFGDLTTEEFLGSMKKSPRRNRPPTLSQTKHVQYNGNPPGRFDWREKGAVTPVQNQGACAGYFAFSAVGAIESANFIKTGKLVKLSEQNLIDCTTDCKGCRDCVPEKGMAYVEKNGIMTEADYPYRENAGACQSNGTDPVIKIKEHVFITPGAEEELKQAVYKQPVSTYIKSVGALQYYESGVFSSPYCFSNEYSDHAVLIIGWGMDYDTGEDYWIIKNSWGTGWGIDGYAWILRNNNECDIAADAVYPVL